MKTARGSQAARRAGRAGEAEARERLEVLFAAFDRLTPDDLARIGLWRSDPAERKALLDVVTGAARASGRWALVARARRHARDVILRRYSQGGLHPTWLALNWGISQGTIEDRVAIVDALQDAAAAAVVADLVEPAVAEGLSLDAELVIGLARGDASEGSLAHVLAAAPPGYRQTRLRWVAMFVVALLAGLFAAGFVDVLAGLVVAAVLALVALVNGSRRPGDPAVPGGA